MVFSGKSGCIRAKVVLSEKLVVFGQCGCIRARWMYLVKSGCIRGKVDVFMQKWL